MKDVYVLNSMAQKNEIEDAEFLLDAIYAAMNDLGVPVADQNKIGRILDKQVNKIMRASNDR